MNGATPRIARWLSREIFGECFSEIIGLRVLDGQQTLTEVTLKAGDDAQGLAEELSETLATYFDGDKRGHTFQVAPMWREGSTPRVGKLAVRITPADLDATSTALAPTSLAALAQTAQANPITPNAADSWRDQARFNASQVGILTSTVVNLAKAGAEQHAAIFESVNVALASTAAALRDANAENDRLRRELAESRKLQEETADIARSAVKEIEALAAKLKEAEDGNRLMAPIAKELGDKVSQALGGIVVDAVNINGAAKLNGKAAVNDA